MWGGLQIAHYAHNLSSVQAAPNLLHSSYSYRCEEIHRRRPADVLKPEHKVTNTFISTCGLILLCEMWRLEGIEPSLPPIT